LYELKDGPLEDNPMLTKKNGQLIYPLNYHPKAPGMNILETPKGNNYSLRLPDGSTAWLNSGSFIQYPDAFTGDRRIVKIQGEVYFDVAENHSMPFIVQAVTDGSEVQALGTRFTVSAYKEDSTVRTTLMKGIVKIKGKDFVDTLQPGEQAILTAGKKYQKITVKNPEQRVQGWTENKFKWEHTDLITILEDLAHWYGYSLKYPPDISSLSYDATFERGEPLSKILNMLHRGTGLIFRFEGTTMVVSR
jgi:ferric-dicitrate binding protein FerR (iron transport regulator)